MLYTSYGIRIRLRSGFFPKFKSGFESGSESVAELRIRSDPGLDPDPCPSLTSAFKELNPLSLKYTYRTGQTPSPLTVDVFYGSRAKGTVW